MPMRLKTAPPAGWVEACQKALLAPRFMDGNHEPHTWKTSTPECVTARLILIPSPSLAGWGLMPYMSSFLATSSRWMSESAGVTPLQRDRRTEAFCDLLTPFWWPCSGWKLTCVSCETWWSCDLNIPGWGHTASSLNVDSPARHHSPLALLQHTYIKYT